MPKLCLKCVPELAEDKAKGRFIQEQKASPAGSGAAESAKRKRFASARCIARLLHFEPSYYFARIPAGWRTMRITPAMGLTSGGGCSGFNSSRGQRL